MEFLPNTPSADVLGGRRVIGWLVLSLLIAAGVRGGAREFYVHPENGADAAGRGETAAEPFQSLRFALARAVTERVDRLVLHLGPGGYSGVVEDFPLVVPPTVASLELVGPPIDGAVIHGAEPAARLSATEALPHKERRAVFELSGAETPAGAFTERSLTLRRISLDGGFTGLVTNVAAGGEFVLTLEDCSVSSQNGGAVEVHVGAESHARVAIRRSFFTSAGGGVSVETQTGAVVELAVTDCVFENLVRFGPGGTLGAAVAMHLEPEARIEGCVERNRVRGAASSLQVTTSLAPQQVGGTLQLIVRNNLVIDVTNGVYLSMWPSHQIAPSSLFIANNTFVAIDRFVVAHDNAEAVLAIEADAPSAVAWTFVNNICWSVGETEFDVERLEGAFPHPSLMIAHNLLQKSSLGADGTAGNFSVTDAVPVFEKPSDFDFRLAENSPAIDVGSNTYAVDALGLHSLTDLAGTCRIAGPTCIHSWNRRVDVGAYEFPGTCYAPANAFVRGDCNSGGAIDISDAVEVFNFLFSGSARPSCLDACDADDNSRLQITDGIYLLRYLFSGGPPPPTPFPEAGNDVREDCLETCL